MIGISLGELLVCMIALALPLFGVGLVVLLVRGTQKKTSMGINLTPGHCPGCGTALPTVRAPKNFRQAMFGGWTCSGCGAELDKWGRPLPPQ